MIREIVNVAGLSMQVLSLNTVVVGTGAAGFNAADRLHQLGQTDIAIVSEHLLAGTSRNTGSDKQTYYKLTLSGSDPDSVREMAETLFSGHCMDGDIALAEAALSAPCFLKLAELGVKFPKNRYGEYIGYKTDHDPRRRATSAGPLTSKQMTECLQKSVEEKGIAILGGYQVIDILTKDGAAQGLICLNKNSKSEDDKYLLVNCKNIVYAVGGPAGMYADSVYPNGHHGSSGLAFKAGVRGKNLTEWQFGLASTAPRWNVSGTYMQVLPRFISTNSDGTDEKEFLTEYLPDMGKQLSLVFLKGYQWPFDVRKVRGGSSIIDILVYIETVLRGREVYLDFRSNPGGNEIDYAALSPEAREYLERAHACFGTPIERLKLMNQPAIDFYKSRGVDITCEPLKIALCAQHNNGGLAGDAWWQSNVSGFFPVGEVNGSHGVYRPGGSALNSGQVGSTRAAQFIAANRKGEPQLTGEFIEVNACDIANTLKMIADIEVPDASTDNVKEYYDKVQQRMSASGAAIRSLSGVAGAIEEIKKDLSEFALNVRCASVSSLATAYQMYDSLISQLVYLSAMQDYAAHGGKSRGSAMYSDQAGEGTGLELPEIFRFILDDGKLDNQVQEAIFKDGTVSFEWRKARPIPEDDDFFENVWRAYREHGNVY